MVCQKGWLQREACPPKVLPARVLSGSGGWPAALPALPAPACSGWRAGVFEAHRMATYRNRLLTICHGARAPRTGGAEGLHMSQLQAGRVRRQMVGERSDPASCAQPIPASGSAAAPLPPAAQARWRGTSCCARCPCCPSLPAAPRRRGCHGARGPSHVPAESRGQCQGARRGGTRCCASSRHQAAAAEGGEKHGGAPGGGFWQRLLAHAAQQHKEEAC